MATKARESEEQLRGRDGNRDDEDANECDGGLFATRR